MKRSQEDRKKEEITEKGKDISFSPSIPSAPSELTASALGYSDEVSIPQTQKSSSKNSRIKYRRRNSVVLPPGFNFFNNTEYNTNIEKVVAQMPVAQKFESDFKKEEQEASVNEEMKNFNSPLNKKRKLQGSETKSKATKITPSPFLKNRKPSI